MSVIKINQIAESLDWGDDVVETVELEAAGRGYLDYRASVERAATFLSGEDDDDDDDDSSDDGSDKGDQVKDGAMMEEINLWDLSDAQLEKTNYYQVLNLPFKPHLTADEIKKAYRKACLKYHSDKNVDKKGDGEEDKVFLKVQAAFDTLTNQKQAYDSTEMPFDEALPSDDVPEEEFYKEYGNVFKMNLFFDARLLHTDKKGNHGKKGKGKRNKKNAHHHAPPSFGDENTPIDEVHRFYDYWTHFSTWRDFTIQASKELEAEDQIEQAESRYEKRWYQQEVNRLAKKLKQKEQSRITKLVEQAMTNDPRLIAEKKRLIEEKKQKQREREEQEKERIRLAEEARLAEEKRVEEEKQRKQQEKFEREKEKKALRKVKQALRKRVEASLEELLEPSYALEDDTDFICGELDKELLMKLNERLEGKTAAEVVQIVKKRAENLRNKVEDEEEKKEPEVVKVESVKVVEKIPFTKEELSALAKGVKKFPPGGANRWDQIANYINNSCRPDQPRTKEECIETFNKIASRPAPSSAAVVTPPPSTPEGSQKQPGSEDTSGWTEEQDKQLQEGLAKFPATMDKNERWTSIANGVPGKTKKDCVQRFKAIRDAIKNKK